MKPTTVIVGRVGRKETKKIGDHTVSNLSLAVNEYIHDEKEEGGGRLVTHWYNIEAWNAKSKIIENHIEKGQLVAIKVVIENNLHSKDEKRKYDLKFIADSISFNFEKKNTSLTTEDIPFV